MDKGERLTTAVRLCGFNPRHFLNWAAELHWSSVTTPAERRDGASVF